MASSFSNFSSQNYKENELYLLWRQFSIPFYEPHLSYEISKLRKSSRYAQVLIFFFVTK